MICTACLNQSHVATLLPIYTTDEDRSLQKLETLQLLIPGYYIVIICSSWFVVSVGLSWLSISGVILGPLEGWG